MFSTFGFAEVIKDVYRISAPYAATDPIVGTDDLREVYHDFLAQHQPYMPVNRSDDCFILDQDTEDALVLAYTFNNALDDLRQTQIIAAAYPPEEKRRRVAIARAALAEFKALDSELAAVFELAIHSIVVRPSSRQDGRASFGGSSSAALGTIWLSLGDRVTRADLVEMLLHELTHHLLFIDERSFAHYDYAALLDPRNQAYSAILNLTRPIDKVFHSIVVACELLQGRARFWPPGQATHVHPASDKLRAETQKSLSSLLALPQVEQLIKPRGQAILRRCIQHCQFPLQTA
jgi:hypothetical protein